MRKTPFAVVLLLLVVVLAAGCRQPDGPPPQPTEQDQNEIGDLSRDLMAVASGDAAALQDLTDGLGNLGSMETGRSLAPEMAKRLSAAIGGRMLPEAQARSLATQMFLTFSAYEFNPRQVTQLQADTRTLFEQIGVPADRTEPVLQQVAAVQALVNTSPRRWYHMRS